MSKTITIPSDRGNPVVVEINGEEYSYTAGAEVTVPDKVADAIENSLAMKPQSDLLAVGRYLPPVKLSDKDKYLHTNASTGAPEWAEVEGGGGGSGVLVAHAEVPLSDLTPSGDPVTITLDKTIAELAAAEDSILEIVTETNGGMDFFIPLSLVMRQTSNDGSVVAYASMASADDLLQARLYVQGMSSGGSDMVMLLAASPAGGGGDEPFVLHGTITSATGGTVQESVDDLASAIANDKRVIFKVTMPTAGGGTKDVSVECNVLTTESGSPAAYGSGSMEAAELLAVYVEEVSSALAFAFGIYELTPLT